MAGMHLVKRSGRMVEPITPDEVVPEPHELVLRNGTPDTIAGGRRWPTVS